MSNLKEIRKKNQLTQSELSKISGVSKRMIEHYEQGVKDINKAQAKTLYNLSQSLGCTIEDLIKND